MKRGRSLVVCSVVFCFSIFGVSPFSAAQAPPPPPPAPGTEGTPEVPKVIKILPTRKQDVQPAVEGKKAPDLQLLYAFENKMGSLKEILNSDEAYNAKLTVMSFINTACTACIEEMNILMGLRGEYQDKIFLIAVVTDRNADGIATALGEETKSKVLYLIDPYFSAPPVFGFKSTPSTVYIKDGDVVKMEKGFVPSDEGRKELTDIVKEFAE